MGTRAARARGVLGLLLVAIGIGVVWPRPAILVFASAPLMLVALASETPRRAMKICCGYSFETVANPYRVTELVLLLVLLGMGWRWREVRPRPIAAMRRLGGYGAGLVIVFTVGSFLEPIDLVNTCRAVVAGAAMLIACLLAELHMHQPALPVARAVVTAGGRRRDRSVS